MGAPFVIAVPSKGRLSEGALELLGRAGLHVPRQARSLLADVNGEWRLLFVRTQDIPEYVATGTADAGITGLDLVEESGRPVEVVLKLGFGRCRLAVAVPRLSGIRRLEELRGKRIATVFPRLTARFFSERGVPVEVVPLSGATEVAPHVGIADATVDLVETGSTLRQHGLVELAAILPSEAVLIASPKALQGRMERERLEELRVALQSVLDAQARRYLMVNVPRAKLDEAKKLLPGLTAPTVLDLLGREDWVALHAVVCEEELNGLLPALKRLGGQGLLVLPIERMVA
jgi:ATP phosphoribosyltransferase